MSKISLGAEVYTWYMKENGKFWNNKLGHMIEVISKSGFKGIEPMHFWMGDYSDPNMLSDKLKKEKIDLAGIALCLEWNGPIETEQEKLEADKIISLLSHFPDAVLCMCQLPTSRNDLINRRINLVNNINSVAKRAAEVGIKSSFHPNSPLTSTNRTEEDYDVILNGIDSSVLGWTPDVGHIANGGMNILNKMNEFASLINHVHYKDWDGNPEWRLMGEGKVNFKEITQWLFNQNYKGWILCEDEADMAIDDPDGVTIQNGLYCSNNILPIIS